MPDRLIDAVAKVAAEAGRIAMASFGGGYNRWEKEPGHPVCDVDLAVDAMVRARLREIDPEAGWLSEETVDNAERLMGVRTWVVDPIDGTRDYLRGRPGWAVSIALVEGGNVVLGVLDAPVRGERWSAVRGHGATRNGVALRAGGRTELVGARTPAEALPRADRELTMVERPNSIALRIAMVAADEADLVATLRWGHEWDIAAAALIAQEAGAVVTDGFGDPLRYNSTKGEAFGCIAAVPGIHAAAVAHLGPRATAAVAR
ncbi:3'(2'),5'-bisphosphate nucleotidase CysQ [Sphingomonas prati]|uniref:Myo-inositol-1(Or 4)-monophosphatase n=1 Tax=Sphingomonas prati TaxID=1843237 RepID=A0A7W9BR70_9SPHN|nr:3'(2'),5'-bisphosphate nucleotidase CysQ [Sphingomonas prati]MBB5728471.1 myo-inositol-1(or 4)-monophosphatase [Sphingomonas prati]GGE73517.1 3'(2'),5'-bisphosphate nucleotidase CysQ [Sphingomonas prati]